MIRRSTLWIALLLAPAVGILAANIPDSAEGVKPLILGTKVPAVEASRVDGKKVAFLEILSKQPTILVFYRGGW